MVVKDVLSKKLMKSYNNIRFRMLMSKINYGMRKFTCMVVLLAGQLLISCSDDDDPGADHIEVLPAATMLMEFETFAVNNGRQESFGNAIRAGGYISSWKKFINNDLNMPVTAYLISTNKGADYIDGRWVWNADFKLSGDQYKSSLSAIANENEVVWEMLISKPGTFDNFVALKGQSALDRKSGSWSLYKYPVDSVEAVKIKWEENAEGVVHKMKYTAHKEGSFIEYSLTGETMYDGLYNLLNNGNTASVGWNRDKKNGWIMEQAYYQDDQRHCWNISFEDDECE